jgi:hypothetical protein
MRFLSIDPSMNRIGWALYDTQAGGFDDLQNWSFGSLNPLGPGRANKLLSIKRFFCRSETDQLICEMPAFFESERGRIAAKEGYTNDLALVIGTIYGCIPNVELFLYRPQTWKGSVSKEITLARFRRKFGNGKYNPDHDTVDAIMLLRYHVYSFFKVNEIK